MLLLVFSFIAGYIYGYFFEWFAHIILHKFGKTRSSIFSFHWREHHRACRKNKNFDSNYSTPIFDKIKSNRAKEEISLFLILIAHSPLLFVLPGFFFAVLFSIIEFLL